MFTVPVLISFIFIKNSSYRSNILITIQNLKNTPTDKDFRSETPILISYLIKKIRDTKGTFHAKIGSIKDRNGRDITEAEDVKKRWQEYTEYTKKIFMTQITTMV